MIPREDSNRSFGGPDGEFTSTHDDEGPEDLDDEEDAKEQPMIANKESKAVRRNKCLVMAMLAFSAIGVGLATYFYIRNSEESKFEDDFESSAHKVLEAIGKSLEKTSKSLDSLTVAIVSHVRDTNQQWPLVVVPDFALRASKIIDSFPRAMLTCLLCSFRMSRFYAMVEHARASSSIHSARNSLRSL